MLLDSIEAILVDLACLLDFLHPCFHEVKQWFQLEDDEIESLDQVDPQPSQFLSDLFLLLLIADSSLLKAEVIHVQHVSVKMLKFDRRSDGTIPEVHLTVSEQRVLAGWMVSQELLRSLTRNLHSWIVEELLK